ncbi:MAG: FAD-binding protein [Candidatus Tectomicrobia bacterium]|uniref:FAD-binding protein n=1 Tax=Tectimicrobiota bacterium TaxID=2528274 RepID=A0A932I4B0_UNCTE|nr:FAD-binding protein [Candidatus Tectomicrobia bacterium]
MQGWENLRAELEGTLEGEVRFDPYSRALYSTDASMYQIDPIGVVIPRSAEDVQKTVRIAAGHGAAVLPRGGGTSLAGQTVGRAVVMDFSKYMNRVLELDAEGGWVRLQPGLVQDHLNAHLRPHGFVLGPNTSTSSRATLGGMMGNNSSGSRSIVYGKTVDHVIAASGFLAGGDPFSFGPLEGAALEAKLAEKTREGEIHRALHRIAGENLEEIEARYPKIMRRVSGYNLDELVRPGAPFNLAKVLAGAEGTLAAVTEMKVRICPLPKAVGVLVVHFDSIEKAIAASGPILKREGVAAVEIVDKVILDQAAQNLAAQRWMRSFMRGEPAAFLLIEFYGETQDEAEEKVQRLAADMERAGEGYARVIMRDPATRSDPGKVREAGLGYILGRRGDAKPVAFVEDCAVPPERLLPYYQRFEAIMRKYGSSTSYYGHTSVGLLHLRPILNLKEAGGVRKMVAIQKEVAELVLEYGGAMSGEHGDGLARSEWVPRFFGPRLYEAFRRVKRAFDPSNQMNPGKIVDAPPFTDNLRYAQGKTREIPTILDFSRDHGFVRAIELCNGVGECRKRDGTMCPSFQATREEEHSTRGRANVLRRVIAEGLPGEELASQGVYDVLDLCLSCKGCKAECPSSVDMAKIKAEVMQAYWDRHGVPLRVRLLGRIADINRLSQPFVPLVNWTMRNGFARSLMDRFLGLDRRRQLPPLARPTFEEWFRGRPRPALPPPRGKVLLLNDTFTNFNYPEVGRAAVRVLEAAGFEVELTQLRCCGRPMLSHGLLRDARSLAEENLVRLYPALSAQTPIIGLEPSCLLTFRDEYPDLIPAPEARMLAKSSFMLEEFLVGLKATGELDLRFREAPGRALFHGHCHQKSLAGVGPSLEALGLVPGLKVEAIPSGCCGMAGSFGYEKEHYDISLAIGELKLFPAIRKEGGEAGVIANGVSCRQQIAKGTGRSARHLAEVLAAALAEPSA